MKRIIVSFMFLGILASPLAFVRAEDDATSSDSDVPPIFAPIRKAEEVRDRIQDRQQLLQEERDERLQEREQNREEVRERIQDLRRDHVGALLDRVLARFNAAIERLEKLHDRILERVELIEEARGVELTEARAHLDDAEGFIQDAKDALEDIPDATEDWFGTSTASTTLPSAGASPLRALFEDAKSFIRSAHVALVDAITSIKTGLGTDDNDATTTDDDATTTDSN